MLCIAASERDASLAASERDASPGHVAEVGKEGIERNVPIILLVASGGIDILERIIYALEHGRPVVIVADSGGIATIATATAAA